MSQPILTPPPLKNDCFALPPGAHWTPVGEAQALLQTRLRAITGQEVLPLSGALGRVLACDVHAQRANPPTANSAVDGYAVRGADLGEGVHRLPLAEGRSAAGAPYVGEVPGGQALRILTGAAVPGGVDTVILQEDVTLGSGEIAFHGPVKIGANLRRAGEDCEAGALILSKGRRLTPADLALLAATGHGQVQVYRRLRVGVLSTGDELVEAGQAAREDQIFDANRPMLLGLIAALGYEPVDLGTAPDDRARLEALFDDAATKADVILTSGGASAGDEDHVSALLQDSGALTLWRIAMKPGRPLALGVWKGTAVFGLPGNPVAAMVCALVFAAPALAQMAGQGWRWPEGQRLPAAFEKRKKAGRSEFLRARVRDGKVEVFPSEGSGRVSGLSWAEGLVYLPEEAMEITAGTPVYYISYRDFGLQI
ncbi:molybdopterin-binding protein [Cognatishimia sp. SS12]|uniref:molybdopterin-binding protein n=1 Tax=Cognatishimia sp. SS12 TaxID=2979465 RepID=UPI00232D2C17|nr:gephyrin-like molybdotransferase Glp [Cognatishimia sp. SS12]MDC0739083.1 molybdopterin-binding protein [Cognatishimia sp. SS12]